MEKVFDFEITEIRKRQISIDFEKLFEQILLDNRYIKNVSDVVTYFGMNEFYYLKNYDKQSLHLDTYEEFMDEYLERIMNSFEDWCLLNEDYLMEKYNLQ